MKNEATVTSVKLEKIKYFAKLLKTPTFVNYDEVIRMLTPSDGYEEFLIELMSREAEVRRTAGQHRRIKAAKFPFIKSIDEFEVSRLEHVTDSTIRELATCNFVGNKQNIIMIGNPGAGKTHLAIGLGLNACMAGYKVRFCNATTLANELVEANSERQLMRVEAAYLGVDLLIVDELSYLTFNRFQSELLYHVLADRSEKASVIITTNLALRDWGQLFKNNMMVAALIDRVTYRSHVLDMNTSESYRLSQTLNG